MDKDLLMETLKAKAVELAVHEVEWFQSSQSATWIGIDWVAEDVYIIDPQAPDFPQIELAQFEGIDQLFKENN